MIYYPSPGHADTLGPERAAVPGPGHGYPARPGRGLQPQLGRDQVLAEAQQPHRQLRQLAVQLGRGLSHRRYLCKYLEQLTLGRNQFRGGELQQQWRTKH